VDVVVKSHGTEIAQQWETSIDSQLGESKPQLSYLTLKINIRRFQVHMLYHLPFDETEPTGQGAICLNV
jgi:hypothetical protein